MNHYKEETGDACLQFLLYFIHLLDHPRYLTSRAHPELVEGFLLSALEETLQPVLRQGFGGQAGVYC